MTLPAVLAFSFRFFLRNWFLHLNPYIKMEPMTPHSPALCSVIHEKQTEDLLLCFPLSIIPSKPSLPFPIGLFNSFHFPLWFLPVPLSVPFLLRPRFPCKVSVLHPPWSSQHRKLGIKYYPIRTADICGDSTGVKHSMGCRSGREPCYPPRFLTLSPCQLYALLSSHFS